MLATLRFLGCTACRRFKFGSSGFRMEDLDSVFGRGEGV